jgi:hypothetical protein
VWREPWAGVETTTAEVERLTLWFEPPPQLAEIVAASKEARCGALVGVAGIGKSALTAALARPAVSGGMVPQGFVQAVSFLSEAIGASTLAAQIADQLRRSVPFRRRFTQEEVIGLDVLEREVMGPLRCLRSDRAIRLVVDGLAQLPVTGISIVHRALDLLASDPMLGFRRLVVTSRPDTSLPPARRSLRLVRPMSSRSRPTWRVGRFPRI